MLRLVKKDAYQKAVSMTPDELLCDKELIKELEIQSPFDADSHYVVVMSRVVDRGFTWGSIYRHNLVPFHKALVEECVFEISHACHTVKRDMPPSITGWHYNEEVNERQRRIRREKNR